jgi:hypothetical protein
MGGVLLHNPFVHLYLLYIGALCIALICASLRNRRPPRTATRSADAAWKDKSGRSRISRPTEGDHVLPSAESKKIFGRCQGRDRGRLRK